jgi:hypothetical protein
MQNQLVLAPAMSLQDLEHGGFEVVVDRQARHATPELERMALTQQKGFLPLGGEAFHKPGSRKAKATSQERDAGPTGPRL